MNYEPIKPLNKFSCWNLQTGELEALDGWIVPIAFFKNDTKTLFQDILKINCATVQVLDKLSTGGVIVVVKDGRVMLVVDTITMFAS